VTKRYVFQPDEVRRSGRSTLIHHHMDWGAVRADFVERTGLSRQETRVAPEQHSFLINLKGEAKAGEDFIDGRRVVFTPRRPGSVTFVPAHSEWTGWDEGDTTGSYLFVSVDPVFVGRSIGSEHVDALQPSIGFRNAMIEASLQSIGGELKSPDPISLVMVESQAAQLFVQMIRLNGSGIESAKGGLSAFDLKRVVALIDSRPADPPSLSELVGEIGVSRRHFIRAFKQSTGKTPHSFIAENRLRVAADLLRASNLSAIEISIECGFSNASYFTTAFKRTFGVSPSVYRRMWPT
jgi:AraC-like DNA-binding protein